MSNLHDHSNCTFLFSWTAVICNFNPVFSLIHESFGEIFATVITIEFKVIFMKNFYIYFQIASSSKIFATFITIESFSSWTAVICSFNPIFCMKFLHTHHSCIFQILYGHFPYALKNLFFNNFFLQILHLNFVYFWKYWSYPWCH